MQRVRVPAAVTAPHAGPIPPMTEVTAPTVADVEAPAERSARSAERGVLAGRGAAVGERGAAHALAVVGLRGAVLGMMMAVMAGLVVVEVVLVVGPVVTMVLMLMLVRSVDHVARDRRKKYD